LGFDVDASVEGIEGDHAPCAGYKLSPRQKQNADDESHEANEQQSAEDARELSAASKRKCWEGWCGDGTERHGMKNDE
jgi:hypothetical protein